MPHRYSCDFPLQNFFKHKSKWPVIVAFAKFLRSSVDEDIRLIPFQSENAFLNFSGAK